VAAGAVTVRLPDHAGIMTSITCYLERIYAAEDD
jgi:hypothetical protein